MANRKNPTRMRADELSWFSLTHLWFLYYLLLIYVLAIAAELLVKCLLDRAGCSARPSVGCFIWP